jgi:hypothetical protein
MKFKLLGDFHSPNISASAGTIIDLEDDPQWRGLCPPINAMALDNDAADELLRRYPHAEHLIQLAPGVEGFALMIIRSGRAHARAMNESDAILAEAEEGLRWFAEWEARRAALGCPVAMASDPPAPTPRRAGRDDPPARERLGAQAAQKGN